MAVKFTTVPSSTVAGLSETIAPPSEGDAAVVTVYCVTSSIVPFNLPVIEIFAKPTSLALPRPWIYISKVDLPPKAGIVNPETSIVNVLVSAASLVALPSLAGLTPVAIIVNVPSEDFQ